MTYTFPKIMRFGCESSPEDMLFTIEQMRAFARNQNRIDERTNDERKPEKVEGHHSGTGSFSGLKLNGRGGLDLIAAHKSRDK